MYRQRGAETNFANPCKRGVETIGVNATIGSPPSKEDCLAQVIAQGTASAGLLPGEKNLVYRNSLPYIHKFNKFLKKIRPLRCIFPPIMI